MRVSSEHARSLSSPPATPRDPAATPRQHAAVHLASFLVRCCTVSGEGGEGCVEPCARTFQCEAARCAETVSLAVRGLWYLCSAADALLWLLCGSNCPVMYGWTKMGGLGLRRARMCVSLCGRRSRSSAGAGAQCHSVVIPESLLPSVLRFLRSVRAV